MLIKSSFLNAISVVVKIATGFVLNKVLAIYVGPGGFAQISQFQNIINIFVGLSSNGIGNGVTKYIAENGLNSTKARSVISTSLATTILCCLIFSIVILLSAKSISARFFNTDIYLLYFYIMAIAIFFSCFNSLCLAVVNGISDYKLYFYITLSSSIVSFLVMITATIIWGIHGAVLSIVISPIFYSMYLILFHYGRIKSFFTGAKISIHWESLKDLSGFFYMSISSVICGGVVESLLRNLIVDKIGLHQAGLWDALNKTSGYYMLFVSSSLGFYFLPKFASELNFSMIRRLLVKGVLFVVVLSVSMSVFICLFKRFLIEVAFSPQFYGMTDLFNYQFSGEVFRSVNWLLAVYLISKRFTFEYMWTQIIYSITIYIVTKCILSQSLSLHSVSLSYLITNAALCAYLLSRVFFITNNNVVYMEVQRNESTKQI